MKEKAGDVDQALEKFRSYLSFQLRKIVDPRLKNHLDLSVIVSQTLVEAWQTIDRIKDWSDRQRALTVLGGAPTADDDLQVTELPARALAQVARLGESPGEDRGCRDRHDRPGGPEAGRPHPELGNREDRVHRHTKGRRRDPEVHD